MKQYYLSLPRKPVYLEAPSRLIQQDNEVRDSLTLFRSLCIIHIPFQNFSCNENNHLNNEERYVNSCLSAQSVYRDLIGHSSLVDLEFVLGASFCEKTQKSDSQKTRLVFALIPENTDNTADDALVSYMKSKGCDLTVFERCPSSQYSIWKRRTKEDRGRNGDVPLELVEMTGSSRASPLFQDSMTSPVFHDFKRTMQVLDMYQEAPEVQQVQQIAMKELSNIVGHLEDLKSSMKYPLVVVEGMDASGKTTLTQFLEEKLQAARYSTPPPCLLEHRKFFDKLPEIVRRAYYSLGNYVVAKQIVKECQTRAVVMDRYWHSTAAYGIANETSFEDLPPVGHRDYFWPGDLLKPTAVIFLTVSEEVRRIRLGNREAENITFEEMKLNKDFLFRQRLCEAYQRMESPWCVSVDASGTKEQVVEAVLAQLKLQGICLQ